MTHPYSEIAGEVTTLGTRLGNSGVARDAGAGRGRPTDRVDHNGTGNEGTVRGDSKGPILETDILG